MKVSVVIFATASSGESSSSTADENDAIDDVPSNILIRGCGSDVSTATPLLGMVATTSWYEPRNCDATSPVQLDTGPTLFILVNASPEVV